jgi:hypothetical protein
VFSESPAALVDILRATLALVAHYGRNVERTQTLNDVQSAIERALAELDPNGEIERRRLEALTARRPPASERSDKPESARRG